MPADAYCMITVTLDDLYPKPEWNFVFGQASLSDRTGVFSFKRYDPNFNGYENTDSNSIIRSACGVMVHEIGH